MADEYLRSRLYDYSANSNLVLESERDHRRRNDEAKGEVESLRDKVHMYRMGDKLANKKGDEPKVKKPKVDNELDTEKKKKQTKPILKKAEILDNQYYKPKSRDTQMIYEELLVEIRKLIGDQPREFLIGAANDILEILMDKNVIGPAKEREIEKLVQRSNINFHKLVELSKGITDYTASGGEETEESNIVTEEMAVVFDDDDDDAKLELEDEEDEEEEETEGQEINQEARKSKVQLKGQSGDMDIEQAQENDFIPAHTIDAYWLQRKLSKYYNDANISSKIAEEVMTILPTNDERLCENKLVLLLEFDKFDLIKLLLKNRFKIFYAIKLKQAQTDEEKEQIEQQMTRDSINNGVQILKEIQDKASAQQWTQDKIGEFTSKNRREALSLNKQVGGEEEFSVQETNSATIPLKDIKLDDLAFPEGNHLMTNTRCELPEKSWRAQKKGYEEVHIPALKPNLGTNEKLVAIDSLPEWMHPAFKGIPHLNRVQSKLASFALHKHKNLLLCAPTGSGKTNVALLCMLGLISKFRDEETDTIRLKDFKIVYVAPMKALVQECVQSFGKRLESYNITVSELSGDQSLNSKQISDTNIIVTTPEKWDIVTRKSNDRSFTQLVKLIIIDEIHLLHDERGPVLESLVARTLRYSENSANDPVRLVGLSATLPNYQDVSAFLKVDPNDGLFYFDGSYRPVPLQQQFIGITERKALKKIQLINEICYEKSLLHAGKNQILIFTHTRADTIKTAKSLMELAINNETLSKFLKEGSASQEILRTEAENAVNPDLKEVLKLGFAFHHAGLTRPDRTLVEDLFSNRHVQVLVSTATLAWGVNLPCHTVIIKGTQIYNPEKGAWVELSPLDILQMMGRAGRYGLDSEGEGIIITNHTELQYYLSLMNQQLPVESQMIKRLPDLLNAEIVLGSISNLKEAAVWLGYSYLLIRMVCNPSLYGVDFDELEEDPSLYKRRLELVHSACNILEKHDLIKYDRRSGTIEPTKLGKIASYYYITNESIATYKDSLRSTMNEIEILRLFSTSNEFKHIHVRDEEKLELNKLITKVPIPIKESVEESTAKINLLLQAYISKFKLDGFAIASDMIFIQQSATRIMRALYEIALYKNWASLANKLLDLSIMLERRIWYSLSPLRQFDSIPEILLRKLEKISDITWDKYYDLKPQDFGEMMKNPKVGKTIYKFVHMLPKLTVTSHAYPLSRAMLHIEVTMTSDFEYNEAIHGGQMLFWLIVEDGDGDKILYQEPVLVRPSAKKAWTSTVNFMVRLFEPMSPQYFVKVVSDRWLQSVSIVPISFKHMILPEKSYPPTEVLDLRLLPISHVKSSLSSTFFGHFQYFNAIQTQTYFSLFENDANTILCAPHGSGKTVCAELALLRQLEQSPEKKIVYIAPRSELCELIYKKWKTLLTQQMDVEITLATGDSVQELSLLKQSNIIISTPEIWDQITRKWKQRKYLHDIGLYIFDDIHSIGFTKGSTYEIVISRTRFISAQTGNSTRMVALSHSIANATDLGEWLGVSKNMIFNFPSDARPSLVDFSFRAFDHYDFDQRFAAMLKPAYDFFAKRPSNSSKIIFVSNRKSAQIAAIDFLAFASKDRRVFGNSEKLASADIPKNLDPAIRDMLSTGVVYLHEGLTDRDLQCIEYLAEIGVIEVIISPYQMSYALLSTYPTAAILDIVSYDGQSQSFVDLSIIDIWQMVGKVACQSSDLVSRCVIFSHSSKQARLNWLLHEPVPIESSLNIELHDHLIGEIVNKTIESKADAVDYLTWTYYYRRLTKNPIYYNLSGVTSKHISDHLSDLIEETINELCESKILSSEDIDVSALNLGMISSFYHISYTTIEIFSTAITNKTKFKGIVEILASSSEFSSLTLRQGESQRLQTLYNKLQRSHLNFDEFYEIAVKVEILLYSYLARLALNNELWSDTKLIVKESLKLLQAMIDVIASQGWLKPALAAMELSQFIVQGISENDSILLQIPHLTNEMAKELQALENPVESIFDFIDMADEDRQRIIQVSKKEMSDIARFCNAYPNVELNYQLSFDGSVEAGEPVTVEIELSRETEGLSDEDLQNVGKVSSGIFPHEKYENWWVVVGDSKTNILYGIKRVALKEALKTKVEFLAPESLQRHNLTMYLMCDSYAGCDQEFEFTMNVIPAEN